MYQISVHILTTNIEGMEEPQARWTHLVPNERLTAFSTIQTGLPDMWMIHLDNSHFDLIIPQEGFFANEEVNTGNINNKKYPETVGVKKTTDKEDEDEDMGPGYMGWKDKPTISIQMYNELRDAFTELKQEYKELKSAQNEIREKVSDQEGDDKTDVKKLRKEINKLKEDYKQCMEAIQKETHERNKAETIAKILKDTIEAQNVKSYEDMEIDAGDDDINKDCRGNRCPFIGFYKVITKFLFKVKYYMWSIREGFKKKYYPTLI